VLHEVSHYGRNERKYTSYAQRIITCFYLHLTEK